MKRHFPSCVSHLCRWYQIYDDQRRTNMLHSVIDCLLRLIVVAFFLCALPSMVLGQQIRVATFNASLNRNQAGQLLRDLQSGTDPQIRQIAEVIQRVRPDVLLINEFDYYTSDPVSPDPLWRLFQKNYLGKNQNDAQPIQYPYAFVAPVNTGVAAGVDLDGDGQVGGLGDNLGFGRFPGQYGMLVLSQLPIQTDRVRTFQKFLWKDMPAARLPKKSAHESYYSDKAMSVFRLSSKSHWDLPLRVKDQVIHFLVSHPTPPVFDGAEDRNGCRNHDEIRFWADYIQPQRSDYIYDDRGTRGGLTSGALFVIAGDLNADPCDGGSVPGTMDQLLKHPRINSSWIPASEGARVKGQQDAQANLKHRGSPLHDTSDFNDAGPGNLRVDYVLPSSRLRIVDGGVYWPKADQQRLLGASDHRLVWTDIEVPDK